jgi:hypothetical protein
MLRGPAGRRASGLQASRVLTRSREPVIVAAMATTTTTLSARSAAAVHTMWRPAAIVAVEAES